jgi:hypothetical protein
MLYPPGLICVLKSVSDSCNPSCNPVSYFHNQVLNLGGVVKQHDRSWLSLLGFFAVITLGSSLIFAVVFAGVTAAFAGGESAQAADEQQVDPLVPSQTFSGVITDSHCGARHMDSKSSASDCAQMCVRNGSSYSMVDGDRNYVLAGKATGLGQFAGQRVSVTGVLSGSTIKVTSVSPQVVKIGD